MSAPLLSLLIGLPGAGALALWLLPPRLARGVTAGVMLAVLAVACAVLLAFDPAGLRFQLVERALWVASLDVHYQVGVDGLAVLFLPSTALLFIGSLVACWNAVRQGQRLHYCLLLLLQAATLGIFCALDTVLCFVFWELTLLPIYLLLARWGATPGSARAAARYFLIMLAGGVPLLLAASSPGAGFDLPALLAAPVARPLQTALFLLFLAGFALKVPLVPLHTWLPEFALAAPGSLTALLVGLGTLTLLYGAVGILAQSNLRVGLAYASICHVGLVVLGLASFSAQGVQVAVALLQSFSVATCGALLLLEFLRQRTGSTDIHSLGGAAKTMPLLASGFLICGLAGVGMPGTSSFPGEFMLILAALQSHTGAGMAALFGLAIAAAGFLSLYRKAFFGPVVRSEVRDAEELRPREWAVLVILIFLVGAIGLHS